MKLIKEDNVYRIVVLNSIIPFDKDVVNKYFNKIINLTDMKFNGFYKVTIYTNKFLNIIYIKKIDDLYDDFDYKIVVRNNYKIYFKFRDYYILDKYDFYKDGYYFINLEKLDNIIKYVEFGDFILSKEKDGNPSI